MVDPEEQEEEAFPIGSSRKGTQAEGPKSSEEECLCCVGNGEPLCACAVAGEETERWLSLP